MAYKLNKKAKVFEAWAIVNPECALFSVHPTKEQAQLVFDQGGAFDHFKIIRLTSKAPK